MFSDASEKSPWGLHFKRYEHARLKKIARLCQSGTVLDIGHAQYPNPYFRGLHRTGVDLEVFRGPIRYEEELIGDVTDLEEVLGTQTFDNISAGEIIEHVERPYEFLQSLKRFLKPNGRLILSTPNPVGWPCLLFEWALSQRFYYTTDHLYYFPPRWVKRMLSRSGYVIDRVEGVGLLAPVIVFPCPAALAYQVIYVAHAEVSSIEV